MAKRKYSRLSQVEEKNSIKTAILFGVLSVGLLLLLLFFGLPSAAKFAGFLADLNQSDTPIERSDSTPPAPPRLQEVPEFTNKSRVQIEGNAEPSTTIEIFINSRSEETVVDDAGEFALSVPIQAGQNTLYAVAIDANGNESTESKTYSVTYDNDDPLLELASPSNGQSFTGSSNKNVSFSGTTDSDANVTISNRFAIVDNSGHFNLTFPLNDGENTVEVIATDKAGNTTEISLSVNYTP